MGFIYSDVVRLERPDLEKQRNELIVNINKAKTELKVIAVPSDCALLIISPLTEHRGHYPKASF